MCRPNYTKNWGCSARFFVSLGTRPILRTIETKEYEILNSFNVKTTFTKVRCCLLICILYAAGVYVCLSVCASVCLFVCARVCLCISVFVLYLKPKNVTFVHFMQ